MANLAGLSAFVSQLKSTRTNLVNELRHVDAALSVLGKLGGGRNSTTPQRGVCVGSQADEPSAESAMGEGEGSSAQTQAHHVGISP